MKKIALLTFFALVILSFTGCITQSVSYQTMYDASEISAITIHNHIYDTETSTTTEDHLICAVSSDKFSSVVADLSGISFRRVVFVMGAIDYISPYYGYMIKIEYKNGHTEEVSAHGQVRTSGEDSAKITHYFCDEEEWIKFIDKYTDK